MVVLVMARGRLVATSAGHAAKIATPYLFAFGPPGLPIVEPGLAIVGARLIMAAEALVLATPIFLLMRPGVLPGGIPPVTVVGDCRGFRRLGRRRRLGVSGRRGACEGCESCGTRAGGGSEVITATMVDFTAIQHFGDRPSHPPFIEVLGAVVERHRRLCCRRGRGRRACRRRCRDRRLLRCRCRSRSDRRHTATPLRLATPRLLCVRPSCCPVVVGHIAVIGWGG